MTYRVTIAPPARRMIKNLPHEVKQNVFNHIAALEEDPRPHGVIKLEGEDAYRIRVGDYRIVYNRNTTSKQSQEKLAAIGYRILDTGAKGGIVVSPLGIQKGAAKIAQAENVINVRMDKNSTRLDFILGFLDQVFIGVHDTIRLTEEASVVVCEPETDEPPLPLTDSTLPCTQGYGECIT